MKRLIFLWTAALFTFAESSAQDTSATHDYAFGVYNQYDLRNSSSNGISTYRLVNDAFRVNVSNQMGETWGNITYGVFSFSTTYLGMLWSHEFGHSLRAAQVGGTFNIHNFDLPIPYTTMDLPDDISLVDEALSVTGGFEVNALNTRAIQRDFIRSDGMYNDDLSFAFANRIMYPLYSSLIVPRDPEDPNTWINTAGDPVHVTLPVFKNYSNGQVFMADSTVNPELIRYYNQSSILALVVNLADPQLYRELGGAFGKRKLRAPIYLVGDRHNGWTYGTLFSVSPLGYEVYMNNYILLNDQMFTVYFKYGNPFKNNGIGLGWNHFFENDRLSLSAEVDLWDQDIFGMGLGGEVNAEIKLSEHFGLYSALGYKSEGFVIGKQIESGLNFGFGLMLYKLF